MQLTLFTKETENCIKRAIFDRSELGEFYNSLPIKSLSDLLPFNPSKKGPKGWLSNEGKIALQFLKPYLGLSDSKLLARLNSDWMLQYFCGIQLQLNEQIKDKDFIWQTRKEVALSLSEQGLSTYQKVIIENWLGDLNNPHVGMSDATCYESYIQYPTDINLIWQCVEWIYDMIKNLSKALGLVRPRSKYREQRKKHYNFMRKKRKFKKTEKKRRKQSLYLCNKLLGQLEELLQTYHLKRLEILKVCELEKEFAKSVKATMAAIISKKNATRFDLDFILTIDNELLEKYKLIQKIYQQQVFHYENPKESVSQRIVSIFKPYLRPIVRGKEKKRVEFGAKVNIWQVDGAAFIEHLSFEPFHEGIRLKQCIAFHYKHFGELKQLAADKIYATNANRKHCTALGIQTNFKPKGRRTNNQALRKQQDLMREQLGKARNTILEGSFGNDKNHYGLMKIKARNKLTEIAWIFFGIMTANAIKIAKRRRKKKKQQDKLKRITKSVKKHKKTKRAA